MGAEPIRIPLAGIWHRHLRADADPLGLAPGDAQGRWQRGRVIGAVYLAEDPQTAWAEFYRLAAALDLPPDQLLPRDLWRYRVNLDEVADLSSPEALVAVPRRVRQRR